MLHIAVPDIFVIPSPAHMLLRSQYALFWHRWRVVCIHGSGRGGDANYKFKLHISESMLKQLP